MEASKKVHQVSVFADNFQFQLQEQNDDCDYPENWNDALLTELYVCGDKIIGVGTVRDLDIDLTLEVYEGMMDDAELGRDPSVDDYDHVVQCNLDIPSGKLLITGSTTDFEDALKLTLPAKQYGVRIFWSHLDFTDELGFEGEDQYLIQLWPDTYFEERIIKMWRNIAYQINSQNN